MSNNFDVEKAINEVINLVELYDKKGETRICPKCGKEYDTAPALSRSDNETEICTLCGLHEALEEIKL